METEAIQEIEQDEPTSFAELSERALEAVNRGGEPPDGEKPQEEPKTPPTGEVGDPEGDNAQEGEEGKGKEKEGDPAAPPPPAKILTGTRGDQKFEIPADATFPVRVNGEEQQVTLQELASDYSGRTVWKAKFNELNVREREIRDRDRDINAAVNQIYQYGIVDKDPRKAVYFLAQAMGANPHEIWAAWRDAVTRVPDEYRDMTDEERRIRELEDEKQFLQKYSDEQLSSQKAREMAAAQERKLEAALTEAGITREQYNADFEVLKKSGQIQPEAITPEIVVAYHKEVAARAELSKIVEEVDPKLSGDAKEDLIDDLRYFQKRKNLTPEQLKELAEQSTGKKAAQNLSRKVNKGGAQPAKPPKAKEDDFEPISFDEI